MALAWNAGWVNALRGSNPLSSAERRRLPPGITGVGAFFVSGISSHDHRSFIESVTIVVNQNCMPPQRRHAVLIEKR